MGKFYNTGKDKWNYGQPTDYHNGVPYHKLLGPCPKCGSSTFDYGAGWACHGNYCSNNVSNIVCNNGKDPDWWNTDINVFLDGDSWCSTRDGFINLQESIAGFGEYSK